jgi:threonine dehydrogenase-like Zn-dependent dehydrogenase
MRSVAVVEPNRIELVLIPEPAPGPYEVRIKTEISYICNATDRKLIEGHFPGVDTYPLLLGHESAGIIDVLGDMVRHFEVGQRVIGGLLLHTPDPGYASGWGGMSEYVLATDNRAMEEDGLSDPKHGWDELYQVQRSVPLNISVEDAGLLCTWREVYAGFSDFQLIEGDEILVFGAGPVGMSFVRFARLRGLGYIGCVDPVQEKREKVLELGADEAFSPEDPALQGLADKRGEKLDAVIDAVGREEIINASLPLLKMAGKICVYGVIDKPVITVEKHAAPYNFNLLIHQWPTREWEAAAQEPLCVWIEEGKLSYRDFLSDEYSVDEVQAAFDAVKSAVHVKTLLRW